MTPQTTRLRLIKFLQMAKNNSDVTAEQRASAFLEIAREADYDGHDAILSKTLHLVSATHNPTPSNPHNASTVFELVVPRSMCNMSGNLHGGAVALIFDICTSLTISVCSKEGFWDTGNVSRTLNCTYIRPAQMDQKIRIESQVVHLGKRMGVITGVIRSADGPDSEGKVLYTCEHGKAAVGGSSL